MTKTFKAQIEDFKNKSGRDMLYVATASFQDVMTTNGIIGETSYVTVISSMRLGDTIRFAWTAEHALAMEVGTSKIEGRHYVGKNAAKFPQFATERAREVR